MTQQIRKVLILCTGNSARSILAEALINARGEDRIIAYSAGSFPKGQVHPEALALLERLGHSTDALRSKSWDEFAGADAADLDFVITVCDNAAGEVCPIWPGGPIAAHWGVPDPATVTGPHVVDAFAETYDRLARRVDAFVRLPIETMDPVSLKRAVNEIGQTDDGLRQ